ncbi:MAG: fatty acid desaturase [Planctomycetota bacterium]|nr:fatty acid desaturase [Planctomycetaceae bacterium]MDQ3330546.1 fatty acid desaturase [Planctomycetota bacterium]
MSSDQSLPDREPTLSEVRAALPDDSRARSLAKGLFYFAITAGPYLATFAACALAPNWPLRVLFACVNGLTIAGLFVVGHDACHGSLTPSQAMNRLLGRLALLPSLHPAAAWIHSHNGMHHGWTNLRGKDPVYAPFTKAEFDRLPRWRQWAERIYRSEPGIALFYLVEVWWHQEMFPKGVQTPRGKAIHTFQRDRALVVAFGLTQLAVMGLAPAPQIVHPAITGLLSIAVGVMLPFMIWNWVMAYATFQHHTHPQVPWYDREEDWSAFRGQVKSGVHVRLPRFFEVALHNIMDHTAHHVDPKIPLYNLPKQQRVLEAAYPDDILVQAWDIANFRRTLRICQLYDYENYRWLRFDGTPTTERLVPERPAAQQAA